MLEPEDLKKLLDVAYFVEVVDEADAFLIAMNEQSAMTGSISAGSKTIMTTLFISTASSLTRVPAAKAWPKVFMKPCLTQQRQTGRN